MTEEDDRESKTEEPTEKRVQDALDKGQTPISREVSVAAGFLAFLLSVSFVLESVSGRFLVSLKLMFENAPVNRRGIRTPFLG